MWTLNSVTSDPLNVVRASELPQSAGRIGGTQLLVFGSIKAVSHCLPLFEVPVIWMS